MHDLSLDPRAFVRPSPTRGILGGVAQHTNEYVTGISAIEYLEYVNHM